MDIKKIRLANARQLSESIGGQAAFSKRIERDDSQVNQIIGANPKRNIGHRMARHIEKKFRKPKFWLDVVHNAVHEAPSPYTASSELSEAEQRLLAMWRTWSDDVKQYAFGQMLVVSYTQDVLSQMFVVDKKKKVTAADVNKYAIDTVSETGEFKAIGTSRGK